MKERQSELIVMLAQEIVKRKLTAPAVFMLEAHKPLSFLGNQVMAFFSPFFHTFFSGKLYDEIMELLSNRDNIELLILELEKREREEFKKKGRA